MRRSRAGQIVFLEFAGTLPILLIIFMACMVFHRHAQNTRHAYAQARLATDVKLDRHHSGLTPPGAAAPSGLATTPETQSDQLGATDPAVNHLKVHEFETIVARKVTGHGWWGNGTATGTYRSGRDAWSRYDIETQYLGAGMGEKHTDTKVESMPWIFHSPGKDDGLKAAFLRL